MTPRQLEYIRHRAAGLPPTSAARAAGYAEASAKVSACRMEANPEIAAAIEAARQDRQEERPAAGEDASEAPAYIDAESYLMGVVQGLTPPDPVRVSAARALIQYQKARQRAPVKSPPPKQLAEHDKQAEERALLDQWAEKAAEVRARLGRSK